MTDSRRIKRSFGWRGLGRRGRRRARLHPGCFAPHSVRLSTLAAGLGAALPTAASAAGAVSAGVVPAGDRAVIALRAYEVFTSRTPLVGQYSASTAVAGRVVIPTNEPAFGVSARWIVPGQREQALAHGYAVVDQTSVMATHLAEVIKQHAYELLSRQETKRLLDRLGESQPKLCEELVPKLLSLGEVQKVLQQLLREQVFIRDLPTILESLIDTAVMSKNQVSLVEGARQALGRALVRPLLSDDGGLRVVTLDPEIEEQLVRAFSPAAAAASPLEPSFVRRVMEGLKKLVGEQVRMATPVLFCSTPARFHLRRLLEPFLPKVVVLSPGEIPPVVQVPSLGMIR